jgi:4-amino-4-deoxy-L-arabinose transferase-like glycosyltransferase
MPRKINPTSWIIFIFLMTGWFGIWLGYYFFTHGHNYNHSHNIIKALIHWDAGWYMDIVQHGYNYNGNPNLQQNIAFFPLYPIIMKLFSLLFGLRNGISTIIPSLAIGIISIYTFHTLAAIKLTKKGALFATAATTKKKKKSKKNKKKKIKN